MKRTPQLILILVLIAIGGGIYALGRYAASQGYGAKAAPDLALPRVGDHWHATYTVNICGTEQEPIPVLHGDVHTHGDGRIHSHPNSAATAYQNANLGLFFRTHGGKFTKDELRYPGQDRTWKVGERCEGKDTPATLALTANGNNRTDFDRYVPQDGDRIEIRYE